VRRGSPTQKQVRREILEDWLIFKCKNGKLLIVLRICRRHDGGPRCVGDLNSFLSRPSQPMCPPLQRWQQDDRGPALTQLRAASAAGELSPWFVSNIVLILLILQLCGLLLPPSTTSCRKSSMRQRTNRASLCFAAEWNATAEQFERVLRHGEFVPLYSCSRCSVILHHLLSLEHKHCTPFPLRMLF
jgi:hypothetical protein